MTKQRSHWGWGWESKQRDAKGRATLGQQVGMMLGIQAREPLEPVPLDAIELDASRLEIGGAPPCVSIEREARIRHTYGRNYVDVVRGMRGDFAAAPDAVATPGSDEELEAVLAWAEGAGAKVIPWGGGTSVVGGVEGPREAVRLALDLRRMNALLELDETSLHARIQGGATGPELESQLAEHGLTLRFYPQSFEFATLGGWIATRAGGHFATLHTHIDELTASVRALTPRGWWDSWRLPASGAGPSPDRMLLGSEGTLGIITDAWMRVRPRPTFRATASVHFEAFEDAVAAARALAQSGLHPSNCRVLDRREAAINFVAQDGTSVLIVGFESAHHPLQAWMERALEITDAHRGETRTGPTYREGGGRNESGGAAGSWKAAFVDAPYLLNDLATVGVLVDTFETACTWSAFEALHADVIRSVRSALKDHCGGGAVSCRFTHVYPDGPAPYYTFVGGAREGAEAEQWMAVRQAAGDALARHCATITHHHAVGRVHRPWYDGQRPDLFAAALRAAKRELDPTGMLNPGVLFA